MDILDLIPFPSLDVWQAIHDICTFASIAFGVLVGPSILYAISASFVSMIRNYAGR